MLQRSVVYGGRISGRGFLGASRPGIPRSFSSTPLPREPPGEEDIHRKLHELGNWGGPTASDPATAGKGFELPTSRPAESSNNQTFEEEKPEFISPDIVWGRPPADFAYPHSKAVNNLATIEEMENSLIWYLIRS